MFILIAFIGSVCWDLQCYCQNIVECPPEDGLCMKDPLGYEAIQQLHIAIDDDHDGTLDRSESDEVCSVGIYVVFAQSVLSEFGSMVLSRMYEYQ